MNKHNYLMALAMNSNVATLHLENTAIPVKITEVESEGGVYPSPMTTFKCLVVNEDQIKQHAKNRLNCIYGAIKPNHTYVKPFEIVKVIFSDPATIVFWADGTKTVVKCQKGDVYSKETGLALCFAKKALGNKGNFNGVFHEWIPEEENGGVGE